jgi:DNA repair protein REV1
MGHGVCDVVNKSAVISGAKGGATDDPTLIGEAVLSIYRAGKFDATELRGIGIQVQKLEGNGTVLPAVEEGQNRLDFGIKPPQEKLPAKTPPPKPHEVMPPATIISIPSGKTEEHEDEIVAIEVDDDVIVAERPLRNGAGRKTHVEAGRMSKFGRRATSVAPVSAAVLPPAPGEIDPEIWTLLPADDQRAYRQAWINQGHKIPHIFMEHRIASTPKPLNEPRLLFPNATKAAKAKHERHRSTSVRAGKKGRSESAFSIVEDSSKRRDVRSATPGTSDVVDISGSSTPPRPVNYEDAELVELGIDRQVFINLPADVQAEVYREAATSRTTRNHLTKRGVLIHPANAPGRSPQKHVRQVAIADAPTRPKMNGISDIEEIMNMVGEWMDRSYLHAPNPNEVKVIRKYLVRCVDTETGGLGGIQDATRVLGYWRRTCMRLWPKDQTAGGNDDPAGINTEALWKRAFRDIRDEMNALVQARFGGPLVLP